MYKGVCSVDVIYNIKQSVQKNNSRSPSAGKPALLMEKIEHDNRFTIISDFPPFTGSDIRAAHDGKYVEDILSLRKMNGFSNHSREIADSLLWTNSCFYHAALNSLNKNCTTLAPVSGFHHAGLSRAGGFCTFNGLMITAIKLKEEGRVNKVGILDLDVHFGDGSHEIIKHKNLTYIRHLSFAEVVQRADNWKRNLLDKLRSLRDCDIILYQAGADPHIDDPIGGVLTSHELYFRDLMVFKFAKCFGKPLVWNLAGGYQEPVEKVIQIHLNTIKAWFDIFQKN